MKKNYIILGLALVIIFLIFFIGYKKNEIENNGLHEKAIDDYNEAFKDWNMGNFGIGNLATIIKQKENDSTRNI